MNGSDSRAGFIPRRTASIYIHIPFCRSKCDYCDFFSVPLEGGAQGEALLDRYVEKLAGELRAALAGVRLVPSVYIGGGTPSILGAERLAFLLDCLRDRPAGAGPRPEITLEANPGFGSARKGEALLDAARRGGVTRLSLGIQSFDAALRRSLGRENPEPALAAEAFGPGLCLDLMTGIPGQTEELLEADIQKALAAGPGHVSLYSLIVEEDTPLKRRVDRGETALPDPGYADSLWLLGRDLLETSGFAQYEVSNFCLPGKESVHNLRYWRMETWLGLGPAASGTMFFDPPATPGNPAPGAVLALRRTVPPALDAYLDGTLAATEEALDRDTLLKETLLMGFRSVYGPDEGLFRKRFGCAVEDAVPETFTKWRRAGPPGGYIREDRPALTREGLLFLNRFLRDAFAELG